MNMQSFEYISLADWQKKERLAFWGLIVLLFAVLSPLLVMPSGMSNLQLVIFVVFAAFFLGSSAFGLVYSPAMRRSMFGGWPVDTIDLAAKDLKKFWTNIFPDIQYLQSEILFWGNVKSRYCYALFPCRVSPSDGHGSPIEGFLIAHYWLLRKNKESKRQHWVPLTLFISGDKSEVQQNLSRLHRDFEEEVSQIKTNTTMLDPASIPPLHKYSPNNPEFQITILSERNANLPIE